jgi:hypothetical protein
VVENTPMSKVWYEQFYRAEDNTPFVAEYSFNVSEVPEGEIFAVIEKAENLDKITLNGNEVKPLRQKGESKVFDESINWKDVNFVKVPITNCVKKGENILVIEGKKVNNVTAPGCHVDVENYKDYETTEVDAVYIIGKFSVDNFDNKKFIIGLKKEIAYADNIVNEGYPFYAGKAKFKSSIFCENIKEKLYIKIDNANCAYAKLFVNGQEVGVKSWYPFIYDVSDYIKEGDNDIEVVAVNTLFNVMGPNRISGILDEEGIGWKNFIDFKNFTRRREFLPFGIGKAYLLKIK